MTDTQIPDFQNADFHSAGNLRRVVLGGSRVDLMSAAQATSYIAERAARGGPARPLGVISVNLDHLHHFGYGGRWQATLDRDPGADVDFLNLIDGAPLAKYASKLTGTRWPRLAGSDMAPWLLGEAETRGLRVGFLGGSRENQELLKVRLEQERPGLTVTGMWSPAREELASTAISKRISQDIADTGVDMLIVGLGKPRQELWIARYGALTGARVLLAFGAAVDFLAGRVRRAPTWVSEHGLEWGWRLALEPTRLAQRYLVDGPPAYVKLRTQSSIGDTVRSLSLAVHPANVRPAIAGTSGSFAGLGGYADAAVVVVTYNSKAQIDGLLDTLRPETADLSLRVMVADNASTDGTLAHVRAHHPDVTAFSTGGNRGYSGGINAALPLAGDAGTIVILNPDMHVAPGSLRAMLDRLRRSDAGVVVPQLVDNDGALYPSLRREPSLSRAVGDALLGQRMPGRPGWLSEMDFDPESYAHPHTVDWSTGAALMIRRDVADKIGPWEEEYFLYSEETDFFRRVREAGETVWYEPGATMGHARGASGTSPRLNALMAVNRIRYARKFHGATYAALFYGAVVLGELLRCRKPDRAGILATLTNEPSWARLPRASHAFDSSQMPAGAVIIPAHNEAAVLRRTLAPLAPLAAAGRIEVIVACNGCTDGTEDIAEEFEGVTVLRVARASKIAALNAADAAATLWPRLYLDADIEMEPEALRALFERLATGEVPAARPAYDYELEGVNPLVRAFYRARLRMPSLSSALWGAGAYGLSRSGHERFEAFPDLTADDLFVDRLFARGEKEILATVPVKVRTPRSVAGLMAVLKRTYRGNGEQDSGPGTSRQTAIELLRSVRGPVSFVEAAVYANFVLLGRALLAGSSPARWERDDSSRKN